MRNVFTFLLLTALVWSPAVAQVAEDPTPKRQAEEPAKPELTHEQKLDELFSELKRERNEKASQRISGRIWQEWNRSGSASIDLMMGWAKKAMDDKKYDVALDFLDQVVVLDPKYPEGWNRRATLHFMMHNFGKSMADIEQTLELEPRHFGALSGMARIMEEGDRKELALSAYQRVLEIYPMDRNAQNQVSELSEQLAGEAI
ncbi:MAG TPA: hypothetical protein VIU14_14830 [Mesorhizobium sp.]|jgi:tetratricopeptide (TPR) repeat protein